MNEVHIWKPTEFHQSWLQLNTSQFDDMLPRWLEQRERFAKHEEQYAVFLEQLKRKHALETGAIEGLYDITRGTTETLIREGFVESYITHVDSIKPGDVKAYLDDQLQALEQIFAFIKNDRPLSISYVKQLHQLLTNSQDYTEVDDQFGNRVLTPLRKGEFKIAENFPKRDEKKYLYCPVAQTQQEMEKLIDLYNSEQLKDVHVIIKAAWFHHVFSTIHPFQDGNGRMARLLASLVLIQENLFPLTIERTNRKQYIESLEQADAGTYQPLVDLFIEDQLANINEVRLAVTAASLATKMENKKIALNILSKAVAEIFQTIRQSLPNALVSRNNVAASNSNEYAQNIKVQFASSAFEIIFTLNDVWIYSGLESSHDYEIMLDKLKYINCSNESLEKHTKSFAQSSAAKALEHILRLI